MRSDLYWRLYPGAIHVRGSRGKLHATAPSTHRNGQAWYAPLCGTFYGRWRTVETTPTPPESECCRRCWKAASKEPKP